ncbi:DNA repair protein RadC [Thiomicrorhabdus sp. 6S3-12]|uniref:RadC family protein n=1 Tax=Thiomicrorhabdus sp. 6S3-12 TaxID=2819681 RepID=UPI001AACEBA4|nr:DNA repair protein RadC [Thiomicrorhabdus sp. 6S3-12]MBO1925065.1 DNA repair protein RadC [Thiomicrorhabdus sp. 6S3-12]
MTILDWHRLERPREKLLEFGARSLSDAELLAIFLRVGVKGMSAVDLAQSLLNHFGSLDALLKAEHQEFCQEKGLGDAKYVQLRAVLEMARRHFESGLKKGDAMQSPEAVARFLAFEIGHQNREYFGILLLDQQHRLIHYQTLFSGTLNQASIHPREVVKSALESNAAAVILAHNHPSGDPSPSEADIRITETLSQALQLVDIRTLDHIILGDSGRWHSLVQLGKMP